MADDWVCCTNCNLLNTQYIRVPEYEFQSLVMLECSRKCSCESLSDSRNRAWLHPCQCDPAVLGEYDKLRRYFCYIGPNWSQNKCRQLLIALKPLFVLNVLHNSMNDIWLLSMCSVMKHVHVYTKAHRLQSHDDGTWLLNCCHQMSYFKAKMHETALPQTP